MKKKYTISRREMIVGTTAAISYGLTATSMKTLESIPENQIVPGKLDVSVLESPFFNEVRFKVNGKTKTVAVDNRTTLLDALRENLAITGTKKGCDHGQCGACTVLVNGTRINSCLSLALQHEGDEVTTIEGLGKPSRLHPMQAAFVEHDGYQCGYCTPGQICSAVATLQEIENDIPSHVTEDLNAKASFSEEEIKERMSGNICRCGAYANIFDAIEEVAKSKI
ncbi:aldehyde dehydrogenase iron-sulfur subunit PaoA [Leeuwenhoekiella sp. NPDC079379]|uniref:aldehyde dehydrogenase iron-sulfur subunit PaoA n=1 Tax=Leeuwenhoekiella sp. NPDC079379 TaxID=3364122 RepID=UPI0037CC5868